MWRYVSDDWVRQNIFVVPSGGGMPVRVSDSPNSIGSPFFNSAGEAPSWAPDSSAILYAQDGDLFLTTIPKGKMLRLTDTEDSESGARFSPDGSQIAYGKGGDLYVFERATGSTRQLTRERRGDGGITWSPDGRWLAFTSGSARQSRGLRNIQARSSRTTGGSRDRAMSVSSRRLAARCAGSVRLPITRASWTGRPTADRS